MARPTKYVTGLAARNTVNTMPEETLLATATVEVPVEPLPSDPAVAGDLLARFMAAGIDLDAVARRAAAQGGEGFVTSWTSLIGGGFVKGKVAAVA